MAQAMASAATGNGVDLAYTPLRNGRDMLVVISPIGRPPRDNRLWGHVLYHDSAVDDVAKVFERFLKGDIGGLVNQEFEAIGRLPDDARFILRDAAFLPLGGYLVGCQDVNIAIQELKRQRETY